MCDIHKAVHHIQMSTWRACSGWEACLMICNSLLKHSVLLIFSDKLDLALSLKTYKALGLFSDIFKSESYPGLFFTSGSTNSRKEAFDWLKDTNEFNSLIYEAIQAAFDPSMDRWDKDGSEWQHTRRIGLLMGALADVMSSLDADMEDHWVNLSAYTLSVLQPCVCQQRDFLWNTKNFLLTPGY